jgi:hypothetical protein
MLAVNCLHGVEIFPKTKGDRKVSTKPNLYNVSVELVEQL